MDHQQFMWEQEVYNEMRYRSPENQFHTFEGDQSMIGLAFAFPDEARDFYDAIQDRIAKRAKRIQDKRRQEQQHLIPIQALDTKVGPTPMIVHSNLNLNQGKQEKKKKPKKVKKKSKGGITKDQISAPSSFVHVQGVKQSGGRFF